MELFSDTPSASALGDLFEHPTAELSENMQQYTEEHGEQGSETEDEEYTSDGEYEILGGVERYIGGWSEYETDRRDATGYIPPRFSTPMDEAISVLKTIPGRSVEVIGGVDIDQDGAEEPHISGAARRLGEAFDVLRKHAEDPAWWETNESLTIPADDLGKLSAKIAAVGSATPEQIYSIIDATHIAADRISEDDEQIADSIRATLNASKVEADKARTHRQDVSRGKYSHLKITEAALPYARAVELSMTRAAAAAERAAGHLIDAN